MRESYNSCTLDVHIVQQLSVFNWYLSSTDCTFFSLAVDPASATRNTARARSSTHAAPVRLSLPAARTACSRPPTCAAQRPPKCTYAFAMRRGTFFGLQRFSASVGGISRPQRRPAPPRASASLGARSRPAGPRLRHSGAPRRRRPAPRAPLRAAAAPARQQKRRKEARGRGNGSRRIGSKLQKRRAAAARRCGTLGALALPPSLAPRPPARAAARCRPARARPLCRSARRTPPLSAFPLHPHGRSFALLLSLFFSVSFAFLPSRLSPRQ